MGLTPPRTRIPASVAFVTAAGLIAALAATFLLSGPWLRFALAVWLLALLPPYVMAYYRGIFGAAIGFLVGITALGGAQLLALALGYTPPRWPLFTVIVVALVFVALATGAVTELLHRERERALSLAFTDDLTGLPNRRYARQFLEHEFAAAIRGRELAVVLFDLDHFKRYNDRYGHAAGDRALKAFAEAMAAVTRRMNLSARYGGEEFLSIVSGGDEAGALVFVQRIRERTEQLDLQSDERITVSAGVAIYARGMRGIDDLIAAADRALYYAKQRGRDRVEVASADEWLVGAGASSPAGTAADEALLPDAQSRTPDQQEVQS